MTVNVVVTGPESSGTRFVSRWLEAHPDVVARHWSMPSGEGWFRHWPTDHHYEGDRPHAVVLVLRSFESTVASQLRRGMVDSRDQAEANIVMAHLRSLTWAVSHGCRVYPLLYDEVVSHPESFDALFRWLGLEPVPCPEPVVDGNVRYR